jgi:hypothetical protein
VSALRRRERAESAPFSGLERSTRRPYGRTAASSKTRSRATWRTAATASTESPKDTAVRRFDLIQSFHRDLIVEGWGIQFVWGRRASPCLAPSIEGDDRSRSCTLAHTGTSLAAPCAPPRKGSPVRLLILSVFALASIGASSALIACSSDAETDTPNGGEEDELRPRGDEGASCTTVQNCKVGLLCKARSSAPPPGAVGMPVTTQNRPVLGMPISPNTCQKPARGEEGASCNDGVPCPSDQRCDYGNSSSSGGATTQNRPVLGMPIMPTGTCKMISGPPPGAVGLPLTPHG